MTDARLKYIFRNSDLSVVPDTLIEIPLLFQQFSPTHIAHYHQNTFSQIRSVFYASQLFLLLLNCGLREVCSFSYPLTLLITERYYFVQCHSSCHVERVTVLSVLYTMKANKYKSRKGHIVYIPLFCMRCHCNFCGKLELPLLFDFPLVQSDFYLQSPKYTVLSCNYSRHTALCCVAAHPYYIMPTDVPILSAFPSHCV